jgi:hypothetical protein
LFPNPTKEQLNIKFALQNNSEANVEIMNLTGQQALTMSLGNLNTGIQNHQIDISTLSSGVYFMSILTSTGISKQRFVVE